MSAVTIEFDLNGRPERVQAQSNWTLLQLLREGLTLLGTEEGCGEGSCGTCTVLVDDSPVRACLFLAVRVPGRSVTTIEGIGSVGGAPLQDAFVECGAIQCGFCTPGMILSSHVLLSEQPSPSTEQIKEALSGNFCRCGGYSLIVEAVHQAAVRIGEASGER